ncbi:hypothetical protein ACOME3_006571 [Neoechinorhynchus agilis]
MFSFFKRDNYSSSSRDKSIGHASSATPRSVQPRKKHHEIESRINRFGRRRHRSSDILSMGRSVVTRNSHNDDLLLHLPSVHTHKVSSTKDGQAISSAITSQQSIQSSQSYSIDDTLAQNDTGSSTTIVLNEPDYCVKQSTNNETSMCLSSSFRSNHLHSQSSRSASTQRFIREVIVEKRPSDNVFNIQIDQIESTPSSQDDKLSRLLVRGPGFLQDDRLVSLNGRQISPSMHSDRVNRIIRSLAGKTLSVQVLSIVSTMNQSTTPSEGTRSSTPVVIRGSIKRFGTVRGNTHRVHEVTKQNINNLYWLVNESQVPSYSLVQLLRETSNNNAVVSRISMPGQMFEAGIDRLEKANYPEFDMSDQLCNLQYLNETAMLHVIRTRHLSAYPFSAIGPITISLPGGSPKDDCKHVASVLEEIRTLRQELTPPHIVSSVIRLYRNACARKGSHTLCLLGQAEKLKRDLTRRALISICLLGSDCNETVIGTVKAFTDILDIISCCCQHTGLSPYSYLNQNSALLYSVELNSHGRISKISFNLTLSDKSALFYHRRGASVFGLLCAVAHCDDPDIRQKFNLDCAVKPQGPKHIFLNSCDNSKCVDLWHRLTDAFDKLDISQHTRDVIVCLCAVILHLGSCDASRLSGISLQRAQSICKVLPSFMESSRLLGVETNDFISTIFHVQPHIKRSSDSRGNVDEVEMDTDITPLKCICGFAISIYEIIVSIAETILSQSLSLILGDRERPYPSSQCSTVHILNAPTISAIGRRGCFPQLVNNYFAERLQSAISHHTHSSVLNSLLKEFPGFNPNQDWTNWRNKSFKPTQQIMENLNSVERLKEIGIQGLLYLLDHQFLSPDEIISTICSSQLMSVKLSDATDPSSLSPVVSIVARPTVFKLNHFNGNLPMNYDPTDWFAVHRDLPKPYFLSSLLENSTRDSICDVYPQIRFPNLIRNKRGTATRILNEMDKLISVIKQSLTVDPVYCILSNDDASTSPQLSQSHTNFDDSCVRRQMRMFELVPCARIFKSLLSQYAPHEVVMGKFGPLLSDRLLLNRAKECTLKSEASQLIMDGFRIGNQSYACGEHGVYLRFNSLLELEYKRDEKVHVVIQSLQCLARGSLARKNYAKKKLQRLAITLIQRNGRIYVRIKQWNWWKLYNKLKAVAPVYSFENRILELEAELSTTKRNLSRSLNECNDLRTMNSELQALVDKQSQKNNGYYQYDSEQSADRSTDEIESLQNKIEDLKKLVSHKTERIVELENHIQKASSARTSSDNEEDEEAIAQLVQRLKDSERAQSNLSNELFDLRFENESRTSRIRELEGIQTKHDEEISLLEIRIKELQTALDDCLREKEKLLDELESNRQHNGFSDKPRGRCESSSSTTTTSTFSNIDFSGFHDETNGVLIKAKNKIRNLESKIEDLEAELDEQNISLQSHEQARSKAELQLQQERKKHTTEIEKLEEELDSVRGNFQRRLKIEQDKLEEEAQNSSMSEILVLELHAAELKLSEYKFSAASSSSSESSTNATVTTLKKRILQYKALLNDAHLQLEQARADLQAQTASAGKDMSLTGIEGDDSIHDLRTRLEDVEIERSALERAKNNLKDLVEELVDEVESLRRDKNKQDERYISVQQENSDLLVRLEQLEEEHSDLNRRLSDLMSNYAKEQKQVSSLRCDNDQLHNERKRLQDLCESLDSKVRELESVSSKNASGGTASLLDDRRLIELENRVCTEAMASQRLKNQVDRLREQCEKHKSAELASLNRQQGLELELSHVTNKLKRSTEELDIVNEKLRRVQQDKSKLSYSVSTTETELSHLQSKLKLAYERIQLLQAALNNTADADEEDVEEYDD